MALKCTFNARGFMRNKLLVNYVLVQLVTKKTFFL